MGIFDWLRGNGNGAKKKNGRGDAEQKRLIDLHQVVKTYESAAGKFTALRDVDLQVNPGEFVAVIGKSGSGKSTLINMITGIDRPSSGEVWVQGTPVHTLNEGQMAVWRGKNMGIIFQFFQLLPTLSLLENVMLPMDFCNMYKASERKDRAMSLLEQMDMQEHAHKLPSAISGGQQQRVAIARALANDPPILVADEPTGNLDSRTAETVFALFEDLVNNGKTILMVTHDSDLASRVTRTIIISDGEVIEEYLARALPALNEAQLKAATRKIEPLKYNPGAVIVEHDSPADKFYIVTRGEVDVFIPQAGEQEILVGRLGVGQYFGEIALLRGTARTATVRAAADKPVEVIALDDDVFCDLMMQSEATKDALYQMMDTRAEHLEELTQMA